MQLANPLSLIVVSCILEFQYNKIHTGDWVLVLNVAYNNYPFFLASMEAFVFRIRESICMYTRIYLLLS